ncbi:MAG TPA: DotU family type IV/VI secretion system protein [Thermoanaerobaculia bacterium]|nr:DotU family type IV/VI secretion system protein [Thermoanaerobaculia bacterium]
MFLIDAFQQFYGEVIRLKARVSGATWSVEEAAERTNDVTPGGVWKKLLAILERQALEAGREGGDFGVELYRRAQYAMAALADETFLHLDRWIGREEWRKHLLESRLFGSHRAGDELFERIDELLRDRESMHMELARVYLMVLALGFQGKFRGKPRAEEELASYRRRLFRFIFNRDPEAVRGNDSLVPQAYAETLDVPRAVQLPYLKPWVWAMVLIVVVWVGVSHLMWESAVSKLQPYVDQIRQHSSMKSSETAVHP